MPAYAARWLPASPFVSYFSGMLAHSYGLWSSQLSLFWRFELSFVFITATFFLAIMCHPNPSASYDYVFWYHYFCMLHGKKIEQLNSGV